MLTAWLKAYGDANELPGLATGPIEARFHRLREHTGAEEMIIWTTPERRAAGGGPRVRIPALQVDLECQFEDSHICADRIVPVAPDAREPQRERGSVGVAMRVERVELPAKGERPDPLAAEIEGIFDRLTGNRWRGFIAPLREALEAEARDDAERALRLESHYERAEPRIGNRSQENPYRLLGLEASAVAAFDPGEWLDLVNARGVAIATARLVSSDIAHGVLDVDARGADPPMPGTVRPRPRTKILAQKRAILDELESPRGHLPHVARMMASPAAMPIPRLVYPTDYLNPAVGRSRSQARAVALALGMAEGEAMLIEGPPGTGKSTTTGEIVAQIILREPRARVLVCSHSNHGTDNMLMKIIPYVEGSSGEHVKVRALVPARVGMLERVPTDLRRFFVAPDEDLSDRNVVFTTIDALALNDAAGGSVYDYVVLDEANRATVLDSLIALTRGKRFILVGDRLQLQPVLSEAEEQLRLEPAMARSGVIGKSLFVWMTERHFPDRAVVFLDEQNRMHPTIGGLIARAFYEDRLRNGPAAPRQETGVPHFPQPAVWVDTRGLRGLRESRGRGPSLFNVPEARLVTTIARHLLRSAPDGMDVGVIAAYAEQAALLRRMLRNEARTVHRALEIDTVDAFEGREKDIVIVSLVRSNRRREIGFLQLMQRINVALSRARRLLIVVGDTATLRGSYFDRILRYLRERGSITPGPRVIAQLRGAPVRGEDGSGERGSVRPTRDATDASPTTDGIVSINVEAELATAMTEGGTVRRAARQRRSPAEILARLEWRPEESATMVNGGEPVDDLHGVRIHQSSTGADAEPIGTGSITEDSAHSSRPSATRRKMKDVPPPEESAPMRMSESESKAPGSRPAPRIPKRPRTAFSRRKTVAVPSDNPIVKSPDAPTVSHELGPRSPTTTLRGPSRPRTAISRRKTIAMPSSMLPPVPPPVARPLPPPVEPMPPEPEPTMGNLSLRRRASSRGRPLRAVGKKPPRGSRREM